MALVLRLFAAMLFTLAGLAVAPAQTPEPRIALVIGNAAYRAGSLATPANDAGLIAQTLTQAGFDVIGARDLDQEGLRRSFRDFLDKAAAAGPDAVAFVYMAGYGVQYAGENYFAPIEAAIPRDSSVPIEALRISDFTRALADIPLKARFVVLDAAHANPFAPSGQPLAGGLALVEPEAGSLVAFNAAPGTIPPQATGDYGPYAKALAEMLQQGGLDSDEVFARTRLRVSDDTRGAQIPWNASRLTQPVTFMERAPDAPPPVAEAPQRNRAIRGLPVAEAYALALERDTIPAYEEFLSAHPRDPLSPRVEAMLAARREALTWRRAVARNTPSAYWSYIRRYPRGPHVADAHRRLSILSAALEPPAVFDEYDFDLPAPPPEEYEYVSGPVTFFDDSYYAPPPPIYFLPPRPREYIELPPPRVVNPGFLPVPVPVFLPSARPWRNDVYRQPPPPRLPTGVRPGDPGSPQRFVAPRPTPVDAPQRPRWFPPNAQPNVQQQAAPQRAPTVQAPLVSPQQTLPAMTPQQQQQFQRQPQQQQLDPRQARQQQEMLRRQQLQSQQLQQQRDQQVRIQQQRDMMRNQQAQQQRDRQMEFQQRRDQQMRAQQMQQQQREQQMRGQREQQYQRQREQQMRAQQQQQIQQQQGLRQREQQMRAQQQQQQQQMQQQRAQQQQMQMQQQRAQQQMQMQQQMRAQQQMQQQQQRQMQMQQQQRQQQMMQQQMQQQQRQQQIQQQQQQQRQQQPQQQQQRRGRGDCGGPGQPPCR